MTDNVQMNDVLPMENAASIAEWREVVEEDERSDDGKDALLFVRFYESFLKKTPNFSIDYPDASTVYEALCARAQWIAFSFLPQKEGLSVFEKKLAVAFENPTLNLREKVRQWLIAFPLDARDELKQQLLSILRSSTVRITQSMLLDNDRQDEGTVAVWARHYISLTGIDGKDKLAKSQFFFADKSFSRLSKVEQNCVQRLCSLIDDLLLSSFTPEGLEDDRIGLLNDEIIIISRGQEKMISPESEALLKKMERSRSEVAPQQLRARLVGSEEERAAIRRAEESLEKTFGTDAKELRDALFALCERSSSGTDWYEAVAVVRALIRCNGFSELLRADTRFADMLRARYEAAGARGLVDDLKVYPTAPQHLAAFSQFLLVEKLGVPSSDAARHLIQWMNMLAKSGVPLFTEPPAYFSEEADAFQFAQPLPVGSRSARSV